MAQNKIGLKFQGLEEMIAKLEEVEGDLKATTEKALQESKKIVNEELRRVTVPGNFPARGKYSTGRTRESIDEDMSVTWDGTVGSIKIGYDMNISGMTSIFLMRGTPKMKPVKPMFDAIYGSKMKKLIGETQKKVFAEEIKRKMR